MGKDNRGISPSLMCLFSQVEKSVATNVTYRAVGLSTIVTFDSLVNPVHSSQARSTYPQDALISGLSLLLELLSN